MDDSRQNTLLTSVLGAIGNTPLVELSRITRGLEGRILAKPEYLNPGFSKKDRIALQMIEELAQQGARITSVNMLTDWQKRVRWLKTEAYALYIAVRDPRVPWYARVLVGLVLAHTFSPIDLIPDFIPVLGYLDDLIITPLGIALALKMIPPQVMIEARQQAEALLRQGKPISRLGLLLVIGAWMLVAAATLWWLARTLGG